MNFENTFYHEFTVSWPTCTAAYKSRPVLGLINHSNGQTLIGLEQTKRDFDLWRFPLMPGFLIETDEGTYECLDYCLSSGQTRHVIITARPVSDQVA